MKDKWLVTLEINTYDGDPRLWDWQALLGHEDESWVISSEFRCRVLVEEESNDL